MRGSALLVDSITRHAWLPAGTSEHCVLYFVYYAVAHKFCVWVCSVVDSITRHAWLPAGTLILHGTL